MAETVADLRERLDREGEERRQLTDQRTGQGPKTWFVWISTIHLTSDCYKDTLCIKITVRSVDGEKHK